MGPRQRQFFYADSLPWMAGKLYTWLCTDFELPARPFLFYTSHRFNLLHGEYGHNSEASLLWFGILLYDLVYVTCSSLGFATALLECCPLFSLEHNVTPTTDAQVMNLLHDENELLIGNSVA